MEIKLLSFILMYSAIAIMVYYFIKGMIILDINSKNDLEMDVKKDRVPITMASAFVGLIWIVYIPYLIIKVSVDNFQRD